MSTEQDIRGAIDTLVRARPNFWLRSACGVTRSLALIYAILDRNAYTPDTSRARILLIGGLSGYKADVDLALRALELYAGGGDALALRLALSAVPCANPDGLRFNAGPGNGAGGNPTTGYPPEDNFFFDDTDPEKRYLWRWVCFQAPDLVLELQEGRSVQWEHNEAARSLAPAVASRDVRGAGLIAALGTGHPDGLGSIPGLKLTCFEEQLPRELSRLFGMVRQAGVWSPSNARRALDARRSRPRMEIGRILGGAYGQTFDPVVYTQGVPISGRLRLAELEPGRSSPAPQIAELLQDFTDAAVLGFGEGLAPSALASVVWSDELTKSTGDGRYANLIVAAANRYQDPEPGQAPPPSDRDFRTEDMFMNGAVLGRAYEQTGNARYLDLLTKFLINSRIQQSHGLFWHCRSAQYYWGRGNGFAAMGLAETLTYLPENHPDRSAVLAMYRALMESLRRLQHPSGLLSQVLDFPGSYLEFTATCMMGYAMARGLRRGWLPGDYRDTVALAWQGASERIDDLGNVVDACASTGVQDNVRDYLDRPAIFGPDDRSGGMALWFAVEAERLERGV